MNRLEQRTWRGLSGSFSSGSIAIPSHIIAQKRILITGAGGSIGSALAHTIVTHKPAHILLLDASEHALYRIDRELAAPHKSILASVCDEALLQEVFENDRPQIVFHAAAFKHVPLMEQHPFAALQNNAVATFSLMRAAIRHRVEQIVLVSTDKAVEPASIMGASKRVAELTALALQSTTSEIKAVRLGNVYASQGSVVPLFAEQIAQHKPLTVTHPDATRYFLTVEQAAALLLFALSGEFPSAILVPRLVDSIRIDEIAKSLIRQSSSQSQIVYTGLRAGEKLHEQLLSADESFLTETDAPLRAIRSATLSAAQAGAVIEEMRIAIRERNLNQLLHTVTRLIPAYRPSEPLLAEAALQECRI
jgi:FlaA1/EpsC-like NDP-sugar epimerase